MEDGAGEEGKEGGGPFYRAARANQATSERTDQRTTDEKRGRAALSDYIRQRQVHVRPYGETVRRQPVGWSSRR